MELPEAYHILDAVVHDGILEGIGQVADPIGLKRNCWLQVRCKQGDLEHGDHLVHFC